MQIIFNIKTRKINLIIKIKNKNQKKMKKSILIFAAIVMIAGFSASLMAQTASASAGAKIVVATTITKQHDLHFGTMSVPTSIATVTVPPTGARTKTGSIILLPGTPTYLAADYTTSGPISGTYQITLPSSAIDIASGANHMSVTAFTCSEGDPTTAPLDGSGVGAFSVGATLNLINGQAAGVYTGTFDVTVTTN